MYTSNFVIINIQLKVTLTVQNVKVYYTMFTNFLSRFLYPCMLYVHLSSIKEIIWCLKKEYPTITHYCLQLPAYIILD